MSDSPIISSDALFSFLIVKSDLGVTDPIPTLPKFVEVKAVPPVPTFNSVDAVVMPEFISPVTSPVRFPVTFPVKLPLTSPVTAPTKLVAVATPETLRSSNSVCPSTVSYTHLTLPTKRIV